MSQLRQRYLRFPLVARCKHTILLSCLKFWHLTSTILWNFIKRSSAKKIYFFRSLNITVLKMLQPVALHLRKLYYVGGNNSNRIFTNHPYQRARETLFLGISISNPSLRKKKNFLRIRWTKKIRNNGKKM